MDATGKYTPLWAQLRRGAGGVHRVHGPRRQVPCQAPGHAHLPLRPYETTALKRAMVYQTKEKELDDLLRSEVFVDLYATVRGSVQVSAWSSTSRSSSRCTWARAPQRGRRPSRDASILAYHEYRELRGGDTAKAQARLADLQDYNTYDCLSRCDSATGCSTAQTEAGVRDQINPGSSTSKVKAVGQGPGVHRADGQVGPKGPPRAHPEEQANAMLGKPASTTTARTQAVLVGALRPAAPSAR